jgi:hypothetical protein
VPTEEQIACVIEIPGLGTGALETVQAHVVAILQQDTVCISAMHCLNLYTQRLDVEVGSTDVARSGVGLANSLLTEAVGDLASLQYPPTLLAAVALYTARKIQGSEPSWPSVIANMTGYTDVNNTTFGSAAQHLDRIAQKLFGQAEVPMLMYPGMPAAMSAHPSLPMSMLPAAVSSTAAQQPPPPYGAPNLGQPYQDLSSAAAQSLMQGSGSFPVLAGMPGMATVPGMTGDMATGQGMSALNAGAFANPFAMVAGMGMQ